MKSLKKMTEEIHVSSGKTPNVTRIYGCCWREIWKIQHSWKGPPIKIVGAGTAHFMMSLFSESKGFFYLDFQGRCVSSAAAVLCNGKSYLVPSKEERTRYIQVRGVCVCVGRGSFAGNYKFSWHSHGQLSLVDSDGETFKALNKPGRKNS